MGEVYRALDERLDREVAVKVIRPELAADELVLRRFRRESELSRRVSHPYIATVLDTFEQDGRAFLVMELVEGRRFDALVREERPSPERLAALAAEIAEALHAVHAARLIHRDLKPANVLIGDSGHVKVMDFGLARLIRQPDGLGSGASTVDEVSSLTQAGLVVGTPRYMSPEQLGDGDVDARTDLFALGVMLYEALTDTHPWQRDTPAQMLRAILDSGPAGVAPLAPLARAPKLAPIIARLLEKDPALRYQSCLEVIPDLRAASLPDVLPPRLEGASAGAAPPPAAAPRRRFARWQVAGLAMAGGGALLGLALAGSGGWLTRLGAQRAAPAVAVLPFETRIEGDVEGDRGWLVAEVVSRELGRDGAVRVIGSNRVAELMPALRREPTEGARRERLRRELGVDWVISGVLYREADRFLARFDLWQDGATEPRESLRVDSDRLVRLGEAVGAQVLALVRPDLGERRSTESGPPEILPKEEALLLAQRAEGELRRYRFAEAVASLERAADIDPRAAAVRIRLAETLDRAGFGRRAREQIDIAQHLARERARDELDARRLEAAAVRARIHDRTSEEVAARRLLVARDPDDTSGALALAEALARDTRRDEALTAIDRVIRIDRTDPSAWLLRGIVQSGLGRPKEASSAFEQALRLYRALGSPGGEGSVAMERGRAAFEQGDLVLAGDAFALAAERYRAAGLEGRAAAAQVALANVRLGLGDADEAGRLYEQSVAAARESGDYRLLVYALNGRAQAMHAANRFSEAVPQAGIAVDEARKLDNPDLLLDPLLGLSTILGYVGRTREGAALASEGLGIATQRGYPGAARNAQLFLADFAAFDGRFEEASSRYQELLGECAASACGDAVLATVHQSNAELLAMLERPAAARVELDLALRHAEAAGMTMSRAYLLAIRAGLLAEVMDLGAAAADLDAARALAGAQFPALRDLHGRIAVVAGRVHLLAGRVAEAQAAWAAVAAGSDALESKEVVPAARLGLASVASLAGDPGGAAAAARPVLDDARSSAAQRLQAQAWVAPADGRGRAGSGRTRAQFELARREGLRLTAARLAAALDPAEQATRQLRSDGRKALEAYVADAGERADAVRQRADVAEILAVLATDPR